MTDKVTRASLAQSILWMALPVAACVAAGVAAWFFMLAPTNVEKALSRTTYPLQGHKVVCWEPSQNLRACKVTLPSGFVDDSILIPAKHNAFPYSFAIFPDGSHSDVSTAFDGEEMNLATARARLTEDVQAAVSKAIERQQARLAEEQRKAELKKLTHLNRATYD